MNFQSNQAFSSTDGSAGVVFLQDSASGGFKGCTFDSNVATAAYAAGAVFARTNSVVSLTDVELHSNTGHATQAGAGAIYSDASSISASGCTMEHNQAAGGGSGTFRPTHADALWSFSPVKVHLKDVTFEPILPGTGTVSVNPAEAVFEMCELNPCAAGQQCSYSDFSVSCQECGAVIPFSHSENGLVCTMCKPGLGPTEDAAGCHPGLVANAGRSQCSDCGVHRTAVSSKRGIETAKTCGCDDKYYNASQQIRVCFHGSYDAF